MSNDDLSRQFKKLLEENNKQQAQDFQNRLDAAVDPIHERLDTQHKNLSEQIAHQGEQIANVEKNIIEQFSPITNLVLDHDEQIGELQKAVGLRPKH
jgi:predicted  nucleic acid-binding Zn-ribbon protein